MVTPAFLVIPLIRYAGHRAEHPRVKSMFDAAVLASAGLILASVEPLARDAVTGWLPLAIAFASFLILILTRMETIWVIAAAAIIGVLSVVV
jgi:chromate transporter